MKTLLKGIFRIGLVAGIVGGAVWAVKKWQESNNPPEPAIPDRFYDKPSEATPAPAPAAATADGDGAASGDAPAASEESSGSSES